MVRWADEGHRLHGQVGAGRVAIALRKLGSLQVEFNPLRSSGGDRLIPDAQRRKWAQKHVCAHGASETVARSVSWDLCASQTCAGRGLAHPARVGLHPMGRGFSLREGGSGLCFRKVALWVGWRVKLGVEKWAHESNWHERWWGLELKTLRWWQW